MILSYLQESLSRFLSLFMGLFGWPFLLAFAMWHVSQRIRGMGTGILGRTYYYFVSPGVACHETGHALGCFLTGEKLLKFVPFKIEGGRLGYITHTVHKGFRGYISQFVIATGPVWFGCSLIVLLSWLFAGSAVLPVLGEGYVESGVLAYAVDAALGAWNMLVGLVTGGAWLSIAFPFYLYFLFCVASEITLSDIDIKHMFGGFVWIVFALFCVNLIPVVGNFLARGIDFLMPYLFVAHVAMAFALFVDIVLFLLMRVVWRLHWR